MLMVCRKYKLTTSPKQQQPFEWDTPSHTFFCLLVHKCVWRVAPCLSKQSAGTPQFNNMFNVFSPPFSLCWCASTDKNNHYHSTHSTIRAHRRGSKKIRESPNVHQQTAVCLQYVLPTPCSEMTLVCGPALLQTFHVFSFSQASALC